MRNDIGALLSGNTYPGRGVIIGAAPDGKRAVTAYFIMGRSENSRNRVFRAENGGVTIYPFDPAKVKDPSLIIYSPVRSCDNRLIVTNGDQTDTVYDFLKEGGTFEEALETRRFEPDAPNWTPRVSGLLRFMDDGFSYKLNILKCADGGGKYCVRETFAYPAEPGAGHFIHTYRCDGDPIPSFSGEPEEIGVGNDMEAFAGVLWGSLNAANKVSLWVRYTDYETGKSEEKIFNRNEGD